MPSALQLHRVSHDLPAEFGRLADAARAEGQAMVDRIITEWATGAVRFDRDGEALLVARENERLVAVGGITIDPVTPAALRMRRFYVLPEYRRRGVARTLAETLLSAVPAGRAVGVHAGTAEAHPFWESLGFVRVDGQGITHLRAV